MHIGLAVASLILFISFFISNLIYYKKKENRKLDIRNTFPYETMYKEKPYFYFVILLFLAFAFIFANYVIFTTQDFKINKLFSTIISLLLGFSSCSLFFLPLSKLKEHISMFILMAVSSIALASFNLAIEIKDYKILENNIILIPIIIDSLILIFGLVALLNPSITNLKMEVNSNNEYVRPKRIALAMFEWIFLFLAFFLQISVIVISLL